MGQALAGPRGNFSHAEDPQHVSSRSKNEQPTSVCRPYLEPLDCGKEKRAHQQSVYISSTEVGTDLMSATGGDYITHDNLLALEFHGYLDVKTKDIYDVFYDLDDYNNVVRRVWEEKLQKNKDSEWGLLEEIEASTDLPDQLFHKVDKVWSGKIRRIRKKDNLPAQSPDIGIIVDELISDNEKLQRYTKYRLAQELLSRKSVNERRLMGISIGIFLPDTEADDKNMVNQGALISSYQSEIRKISMDSVIQADVELAADAAGWFDYIYPNLKKKYLSDIEQASNKPIVIPLENRQQAYRLDTPEVSIDTKYKRLLIGENAVKAVLEKGSKPDTIHKLGELLMRDQVEFRLGELNPYKYRSWSREEYMEYGRWLLTLIQPHDGKLNARLISKARKLDLGPGIDAIGNKKIFNNLPDFYEALEIKARRKGRFDHWELQDWVSWANNVAAENDGKFTRDIIVAWSQENPLEPTWKMLKNGVGNITTLVEAMGREPYHRMLSMEECVQRGVEFAKQLRRLPRRSDFRIESVLPGLNPIYKYCGGIVQYRQLILEAMPSSVEKLAA